MLMQNTDASFLTLRVNRGESYAWESLITDTMPLAAAAAYSALNRQNEVCDFDGNATLGVTRLGAKEADLGKDIYGVRYTGSWSEIWPVTTLRQDSRSSCEFYS